MTHAEPIALIKSPGGKFTPELNKPVRDMPFDDGDETGKGFDPMTSVTLGAFDGRSGCF